jgi:hypothetical protein
MVICMANSELTLHRYASYSPFRLAFPSRSLYAQVVSTGKICAALTPMLSTVERLDLAFDGSSWWTPHDRPIEHARWHDVLRPFRKVEKLRVDASLWDLSRALSQNDDGSSREILPELRKILRSGTNPRFRDVFDGFIAARRDAGQRIVKRRRVPILYLGVDSEDSEGEDEEGDEDEDERESDEEEDEEEGEEGDVELGVENDRETEKGSSNTDTESDFELGSEDDPGSLTEFDSDF